MSVELATSHGNPVSPYCSGKWDKRVNFYSEFEARLKTVFGCALKLSNLHMKRLGKLAVRWGQNSNCDVVTERRRSYIFKTSSSLQPSTTSNHCHSAGLPFWSTTPPAGIPCYCTVASDLWRSEVNGWMEGMRHDILCYIFRLLPLIYPSHYSISLSCLRTRTINTHVQAWPASNGTHNGSFPRASRVATVVWWKMTSPPTPPCLSLSLSPATLLCVSLSLSLS